jgi:HD-GYP domain-containing protein (c-di-GMP phosphodiesterase class II)
MTAPGSPEKKLQQVAESIGSLGNYEAVDFMVLEGANLTAIRHQQFACIPTDVARAWEASVQSRDELSAFAEFQTSLAPILYKDVQADPRLNLRERQLASLAGLESILVVPLVWDEIVHGALAVTSRIRDAFNAPEVELLNDLALQVSALLRQENVIEELGIAKDTMVAFFDEAVMMLAFTAEAYDGTTGAHLHRVRRLAELLGHELSLEDDRCRRIGQAALLHDLGKIGIPRDLLTKPTELTSNERTLVEDHTTLGEMLLRDRRGFELSAKIARWHHERWDGSGYPDGLCGEEIPLDVSIVTVADAFDAMSHDRPYRSSVSNKTALMEILQDAGKQFHPDVSKALASLDARGGLVEMDSPSHRTTAQAA